MLVLYYDINGIDSRIQKLWNTQTREIETIVLPPSEVNFNFLARFVDAYELGNDVLVRYGLEVGPDYLGVELIPNVKLLSFNVVIVPGINDDTSYKKVSYYNRATKTLEYKLIGLNRSPVLEHREDSYINNFTISNTEIIDSSCLGTTKREVYYNGSELVNINFENSTECGFIAPPPGLQVFEAKVIKIDHSCHPNPVFLKWRNSLGGWDQFMFDYDQQLELSTKDTGQVKNYLSDISSTSSNVFDLEKVVDNSFVLGSDKLTENEYNGLVPDLLISPSVYIVYPIGNGKRDLRVQVKGGTYSTNKKDKRYALEFEIVLPPLFQVRN